MSAVVTKNNNGNSIVRMAIIANKSDVNEQIYAELQLCVTQFTKTIGELGSQFSQNDFNCRTDSFKSMNISISPGDDCLARMTRIMRTNIFNDLFNWLNYAEIVQPPLDMKKIDHLNGLLLTNHVQIINKTPYVNYDEYGNAPAFREKFCILDTHYGTGFEDIFKNYVLARFTSLTGMLEAEISIANVYVSYYYNVDAVDPPNWLYAIYQFHFAKNVTYYLQLSSDKKMVCEYVLSKEIGQLNIATDTTVTKF